MARLRAPNVEKLERKKDVKGLTQALGYVEDWEVRRDAARALGRICRHRDGEWDWYMKGSPPCVEPLIVMVSDENPQVSLAAVSALGEIGDHRALGSLVSILQDESTSAKKRKATEEAMRNPSWSIFTELQLLWSIHGAPWKKK